MGRQVAVIIEQQFMDDDGKVVVFRQPEWKVACWDAIEALPDHDARSWALEKLLWSMWERDVDVEHVVAFVREKYRARDAQSRLEEALETGNV
jgi:hypothetical protein